MKNRYGVEYNFGRIAENRFQFVMGEEGLRHCRIGGKEGQKHLDFDDLGFFDPSGGPFIECGSMIFPDETNDGSGPWTVKSIFCADQEFFVEVE